MERKASISAEIILYMDRTILMTPNSRLAIVVKANTLVKITLDMVKNFGVKESVYLTKLKQRYEKQHLNENS